MEVYLLPIEAAVVTFLLLSIILTLPFILYQHRKHGAVSKLRTPILLSFLLYMLCVYYLTILPLPDPKTFEQTANIWDYINLNPLGFIRDFVETTQFKITDITTYLPAMQEKAFYQPLLNILMTVPFGMYLGYYFKDSLKKTVLLTFLLSLFFELTQLSGLYGIYSHPYRLFDVDDLILNTLGGLIGFLIYKRCLRRLPPIEK